MYRLQCSTPIGRHPVGRRPAGRISSLAVASTILFALTLAGVASSTTVVEGALFDDLQNAQWVVVTTIGPSRVETDVRGVPQTVYGLEEVRVIKGDEPPPFEIRIDGGVTDSGFGLRVPGVPEFSRGDRVLLFLRFDNPVCPIIGFQVRSFRIDSHPGGGAQVTTYDGRPVLGLDAGGRIRSVDSAEEPGLRLAAFTRVLEEMMERPDYQDRSR